MLELQGKKIIIYGAGNAGHRVYDLLQMMKLDFFAFCDTYKSGTDSITGFEILHYKTVGIHKDAIIIIGLSDYYKGEEVESIILNLNEVAFPANQVLKFSEFIKLFVDADFPKNDWQENRDSSYNFNQNLTMIEYLSHWIDPTYDKSIVDLGAGNMSIKKYLSPDIQYYPVDFTSRSPETIVIDLNKNEFPNISADVYLLCAMLYYISNPDALLKKVASYAKKKIIISLHGDNYIKYPELMHVQGYKSYMYKDEITSVLKPLSFELTRVEFLESVFRLCLLFERK